MFIPNDIYERFITFLFGMSVIGQLWIWPIILYSIYVYPYTIFVYLLYTLVIALGPHKNAHEDYSWTWTPFRDLHIWKLMAQHFSARFIRTCDLDPNRKYIFACFPHGISALSGWIFFATNGSGFSYQFPNINRWTMTLASNFKCPIVREFCLLTGLRSCSKKSCVNMLENKGTAIILFPGGASESLITNKESYDIIVRRRKGFVRVALKTGADIVPCFCFNDIYLFDTYIPPKDSITAKLQILSHRLWGTSQPIFWGRGFFTNKWGILPYRVPLTTVVGKPIQIEKVKDNISQNDFEDLVDKYHDQYIYDLRTLYNVWSEKLGITKELNIR
jgi:1-acyl-sn-glycerol-3-phosphate acyltransferase